MASLSLKHVSKIYPGGVKAVGNFSLDVEDGEFVVIVGPSGCGKTSVLRMIAGLESLSSGELEIDGVRMNDVEPKNRDIAMVFQNYALYPYMTVYDNLALGLKLRHAPEQTIRERVAEAAEMLGMTDILDRKASKLSGGEKQRVAIGRAIVRRPKVFLLDEPLSDLDAKLRVQMRMEIAKLHHKLRTTFIYVTHDQTEAMTMGERIVVMKDGYVRQTDAPMALYDRPSDLFVATFLGSPQMNIFDARLTDENGELYALIGDRTKIAVSRSIAVRITDKSVIGGDIKLGIRPEDIHYEQAFSEAYPQSLVDGVVDVVENLGNENIVYLNVDGKDDYTVVRMDSRFELAQGKKIKLCFAPERLQLFDPVTEKSLVAVPDYNNIAAEATARDGKLCVAFGDSSISFDGGFADRITDKSVIGKKVTLGIPPTCLKTSLDGCDCAITGKVEFFERYSKTKALYMSVDGADGYFIAIVPIEAEIVDGKPLTLYFSSINAALFDADGTRIIAELPINGNGAACTVAVKGGKTVYTLYGENGEKAGVLKYEGGGHEIPEKTEMYIDIHGMRVDDKQARANKSAVLKGVVTHVDESGEVIAVDIKGLKPFTVVLPCGSAYSVGDRIRLAVERSAIAIGRYEKLSETLGGAKNDE